MFDGPGTDSFKGGNGTDTLEGEDAENLWSVSGTNKGTLNGENFDGVENLFGGDDKDHFEFRFGGQLDGEVRGGWNVNTLDYASRPATTTVGVTVDLTDGSATAIGGGAAGRVSQIQNVIGTAGPDDIRGDAFANVLAGLSGDDTLTGESGRDALIGGTGADSLDGGAGEDVLVAGSVSYEEDAADLIDLRFEWEVGGLYEDRVDDLRNGLLAPSEVTFDDGALDVLTGGTSDLDYFLGDDLDDLDDITDFDPFDEESDPQ
jgi:Ca2+-binding RTX toxin-like protein